MENVPSSAILAVVGVIAAAIVVSIAFMLAKTQTQNANDSNRKMSEMNAKIDAHEYESYLGRSIRGSEVLAAINAFDRGDAVVTVINGSTETDYVAKRVPGEEKSVHLTDSEQSNAIKKAQDISSENYVSPAQLYVANVYHDANTNEVSRIEFSVADTTGSTSPRPSGSGDVTPVDDTLVNLARSITYMSNDGSGQVFSKQSVTKDVETHLINSVPIWNHHTFQGWSESEGGAAIRSSGSAYTPADNVTFYAIWKQDAYTIKYDLNGGTGTFPDVTVNAGETYTIKNDEPTKDGYEFDGWKVVDGTTTYKAGDTFDREGDVTLRAIWRRSTYTVRFDANGGSGYMSQQTFREGQTGYLNENKFAKKNSRNQDMSFIGWTTNATREHVDYTDQEGILFRKDVQTGTTLNLYALWEDPQEIEIKYDLDGGEWSSNAEKTDTVASGSIYRTRAELPTKSGYTFAAWEYTDAAGKTSRVIAGDEIGPVTSDTTLRAVFEAGNRIYVIREYEQKISASDDTSNKDNWKLSGTFTHATSKASVTLTNDDIEDIDGFEKPEGGTYEISAKNTTYIDLFYKRAAIKLTVKAGEGTVVEQVMNDKESFENSSKDLPVSYDDLITLKATVQPGYEWDCWSSADDTMWTEKKEVNTTEENRDDIFRMPEYSTTITATASATEYKISYELDGGSIPDNQKITSYTVTTETFTLPTPKKPGFAFVGWTENGVNEEPDPEKKIENGTLGDKSFTAHWRQKRYTLIYDKNGSGVTGEMESVLLTYGTVEEIAKSTFARDGFVFIGWNTKANGTGVFHKDGGELMQVDDLPDDTLYLYAMWTKYPEAGHIVEPGWSKDDADGDGIPDNVQDIDLNGDEASRTFTKDPHAVNDSSWNAWTLFKVSIPRVQGTLNGETSTYGFPLCTTSYNGSLGFNNDDFELVGTGRDNGTDGGYFYYYYVYKKPLKCNEMTPALFDHITVQPFTKLGICDFLSVDVEAYFCVSADYATAKEAYQKGGFLR